ncbi:hypothetical protein AGMMS49949_08220 [Alphaproteobacteria bacterium]|nr:hypothetical protein AGMMS49949_08220 [Alphaproteobacteria bacterium]GHS99336.1 hypothetical protein AGMMS50296_7450 [Alphaproteobacteria bacterium]
MPPDSLTSPLDTSLLRLKQEWLRDLKCGQACADATLLAYGSDWDAFVLFLAHYSSETVTLQHFQEVEPRAWRAWLS